MHVFVVICVMSVYHESRVSFMFRNSLHQTRNLTFVIYFLLCMWHMNAHWNSGCKGFYLHTSSKFVFVHSPIYNNWQTWQLKYQTIQTEPTKIYLHNYDVGGFFLIHTCSEIITLHGEIHEMIKYPTVKVAASCKENFVWSECRDLKLHLDHCPSCSPQTPISSP